MTSLMKVDGSGVMIRGGSTAKAREGWIEISSLSWGNQSRPIHMGHSATTADPTTFAYITKSIDNATPGLMRAAATGQIVRITVEVVQPGITTTYVMKDCLLLYGAGSRSEETIEVNFKSMSTGRATVASA